MNTITHASPLQAIISRFTRVTRKATGKKLKLGLVQKRAAMILSSTFVFLLCAYVCLLTMTVVNVVNRQHSAGQITKLSADVSLLEGSYMNQSNSVTLDQAHALGFKDVKITDTTFLARSNTKKGLSMNVTQ